MEAATVGAFSHAVGGGNVFQTMTIGRAMTKSCLLLILASMATGAHASEALASRYACIGCHQAAARTVGPSWNEIAAKYADGSQSADQLAGSIKRGGSGKWGPVPMPAQPALSDADAQTLAKWVLGHRQPK